MTLLTSTASLAPVASVTAVRPPLVPAQVSAVGGSTPTAIAALVVFFVAVVLSLVVTYRYARGYLRTRQRPLLYLTVGLLLLAPAPMLLRLVLGNVAVVTPAERTLVVTASRLCGLLVILGVVHR